MTLRERLLASVSDIRDRGQRLVQLNLELLGAELKEKGRRFGAAIGLFVGAGVLALYAVGFALATIAVALALVLPLWLSLLIVTLVLFAVVGILAAAGRSQIGRATAPPPTTAAAEARKTADLMKTGVRQTVEGVRATARGGRPAIGAGTIPSPAPGFGARPSETPTSAPPVPPDTSSHTGAGDS